MLILTRRPGERIVIDNNIIIEFKLPPHVRCQVKVMIDAPRHIIVDREEIHRERLDGFPDVI